MVEVVNAQSKFFGKPIHGPREAGIDIVVETCFEFAAKLGIQVKNNNDLKEEEFTNKIKAQITDSKKHALHGLIIFIAADLTDKSIKSKVAGIISDISQMKNEFIEVIPPEKALTIISMVKTELADSNNSDLHCESRA